MGTESDDVDETNLCRVKDILDLGERSLLAFSGGRISEFLLDDEFDIPQLVRRKTKARRTN